MDNYKVEMFKDMTPEEREAYLQERRIIRNENRRHAYCMLRQKAIAVGLLILMGIYVAFSLQGVTMEDCDVTIAVILVPIALHMLFTKKEMIFRNW